MSTRAANIGSTWRCDIEIRDTLINEKWSLRLPWYRAERPEWPWWEAARLAAMHHVIEPGMVVYDVGAEEGDLSALYATWGARLVLVEPNPRVWPTIRLTFAANQLETPGWFVGLCSDVTEDEPPLLDVEEGERDGWPICACRKPFPEHGFRHLWEHTVSTPQVTLDDLVARTGLVPDVVTMDVEGSEGYVVRGALDTLKEFRPVVFISIHPEFMKDLYGEHPLDIHRVMADMGYRSWFLATDHEDHFMYLP